MSVPAGLPNSWNEQRVVAALPYLDAAEAELLTELLPGIDAEGEGDAVGLQGPDYLSWLRKTIPAGWSVDAPHIRLISEHLDAVTRGEIDRLALHMPPRHSKTETTTVRYPLYRLAQDPTMGVLVTGYNERFARKLGRKTRNLAAERGMVAADKSAADEWALPQGGWFMARGVGSPPTGSGFSLILIDDPIRRREDAESEVYREKVWDWYTDDLYTRLEPGGAIVLIMTLWHEDDVGARAVASEPGRWTVLKLPALAGREDPVGRSEGEALWPQRFDVTALERIRSVLTQNEGERSWQALYQQNPTAREGDLFKVAMLQHQEAAPAGLRLIRAWDHAATAGGGDWTAGVLMGTDGEGRFYVLDVVRGRWGPDERNREILATARLDALTYPKGVRILGPQDPGSAGVDAAKAFVRLLVGFPVEVERVTGDKQVRADPFAAQVNAGNVTLITGAKDQPGKWVKAYVEELRSFPRGANDDQVDASSDAFTKLASPKGYRPAFGAGRERPTG